MTELNKTYLTLICYLYQLLCFTVRFDSSLTTFRYDLGQRITALRKKNGISHADLGKRVETSGDIIGKYEREEVKPSIEVVIVWPMPWKFLWIVGKTDVEMDSSTLNRIREVTAALPDEDRKQVFMVVDTLIRDFKAKKAYAHK